MVWRFLFKPASDGTALRAAYEALYHHSYLVEEDEVYQVLATWLRGNQAVDIGCGVGLIEKYSPETYGVDFSWHALKQAQQNGAQRLVQTDAEALPFKDDSFQIALSNGVLEHLRRPQQAISEMARIARVQVLIVHARLPFPLELFRPLVNRLWKLESQPWDKPLSRRQLKKFLSQASLKVVYEGFWNYIDLRYLWSKIPYGLLKFPSHLFFVTIKSQVLERRFMGHRPLLRELFVVSGLFGIYLS